jgi:hypothetical protein
MKQTIQNRINSIKALSASKKESAVAGEESIRIVNDNLSKSIRNKKEAEVFQKELEIAMKLAKR